MFEKYKQSDTKCKVWILGPTQHLSTPLMLSFQNDCALCRECLLLLTSNRLAVSSSSSCSSWFLTCDRRSHSLSFSFSSWVVREKMSQPHLTGKNICNVISFFLFFFLFTLSFGYLCVREQSRLQHLLCSVQLFPQDLWALFSYFFFSDLKRGAAEPGEVAMVSAWGGPSLASSLHSGIRLWIQIYQPADKFIVNTNALVNANVIQLQVKLRRYNLNNPDHTHTQIVTTCISPLRILKLSYIHYWVLWYQVYGCFHSRQYTCIPCLMYHTCSHSGSKQGPRSTDWDIRQNLI